MTDTLQDRLRRDMQAVAYQEAVDTMGEAADTGDKYSSADHGQRPF